MIKKDKHYYYKGTEYVVTGFTKMKVPSSIYDTNSWQEAVQYKRASEVDDEEADVFTMIKTDFVAKFIPTVLEADDYIVAVSMGKIVAEYKVTEVEGNEARALSPSGVALVVNKEIDSDGICTRISGGVAYTADYCYEMDSMKMRITNEAIINAMCSSLSDGVTRVQTISLQNTTFSLQEAQKSIDQTLKAVYAKFGV